MHEATEIDEILKRIARLSADDRRRLQEQLESYPGPTENAEPPWVRFRHVRLKPVSRDALHEPDAD